MPRRKVFICYSHKDQALFNELRTHLAPFEHQGLLLSWSDQEIRPSEPWDRRIHEAIDDADAAVMLVSPDMLASEYVVEEEIPRLIEAAEAGRLHLTSLFLRASSADARTFDVVDATTGERGIRITKYQGLNQPDNPVAKLDETARDDLLAQCVRKLRSALEELPDLREWRRTMPSRELSVELRLRDGQLHRGYASPRLGTWLQNHGTIDLSRLTALTASTSCDDLSDELGARLFEILLGNETEWRRVLRGVLGDEAATPIRHGLRLRIVTADPVLCDLPWALSRWQGYCLADQGWTFEHAARLEPPPRVWVDTPCTALMVAAEDEEKSLAVEGHWTSFQALLNRVWNQPLSPGLIHLATTPDETVQELAAGPRLVYAYCQAREEDGQLVLVLRDEAGKPSTLPFARLAEALTGPPHVLFLHTVGPCPPAPPIPGLPLVLHLRRRTADWGARSDAQSWWNDVLGGRWDPVRAFHDLGPKARRCGLVRTNYDSWETTLSDLTPKVDRARSRLDRKDHREAVMGVVRRLVLNPQRRVACVVAYGPPGNLVDHFVFQVIDTLKDWATDLARIQRQDLKFPERRDGLDGAHFVEHFRDLMELQPGEKLGAKLIARRGGPTATPVHFLNWGCYGPDPKKYLPPVRSTHLETWLRFCCDHLAPACPERSRILSYVALVTPAERHEALRELVEAVRMQPELRQPRFEVLLLPALGEISANDLVVFLEDEDNTSCPREYLHDVPERIHDRTGGEFEATVKLLEEAESGMMWPELYRTLPKASPVEPRRKDFEL